MITWQFVFFFFQAEDGIRDGTVTGVQTCALPISLALLKTELELALRRSRSTEELEAALRSAAEDTERLSRIADRSEERRVGKSVDLGGSRISKKKKREYM